MKTQAERDQALIDSIHRAIIFTQPNLARLVLFALATGVGLFELGIENKLFAGAVTIVMLVFASLVIFEASRFGYSFCKTNGRWLSFVFITCVSFVIFFLHRIFEHYELVPLHRTAFWSLLLLFGFILGVLVYAATKKE